MENEPTENNSEQKTGKVVCSVCKKIMSETNEFDGVSHAYCPECLEQELKKVEEFDFSKYKTK